MIKLVVFFAGRDMFGRITHEQQGNDKQNQPGNTGGPEHILPAACGNDRGQHHRPDRRAQHPDRVHHAGQHRKPSRAEPVVHHIKRADKGEGGPEACCELFLNTGGGLGKWIAYEENYGWVGAEINRREILF